MFTTLSSSTQGLRVVTVSPPLGHWKRRIAAKLRRWFADMWLDPRACYLAQAQDHADLEQRLREWDRQERYRTEQLLMRLYLR